MARRIDAYIYIHSPELSYWFTGWKVGVILETGWWIWYWMRLNLPTVAKTLPEHHISPMHHQLPTKKRPTESQKHFFRCCPRSEALLWCHMVSPWSQIRLRAGPRNTHIFSLQTLDFYLVTFYILVAFKKWQAMALLWGRGLTCYNNK